MQKEFEFKFLVALEALKWLESSSFVEGSIPLSTLQANVDYANVHAETTYGIIGVKVWIIKVCTQTQKKNKQIHAQQVLAVVLEVVVNVSSVTEQL